jgi:hypothetical protein
VKPGFKINLWGNDGGATALAVTPALIIPTEVDGDVMGSVGLPFALHLPEDFTVKIVSEMATFENSHRTIYLEFANNASITKSFTPHLDAFANFTSSVVTQQDSEWLGYAGLGVTYAVARNFQLYGGIRFGVTSIAFDHNPYFGLAWRY